MAKKKIQINIRGEELKKKLNIRNGVDGKTPIKNVDYFDGKDAPIPDTSVIALEASKMSLEEVRKEIPTLSQLEEKIPELGEPIVVAINELSTDDDDKKIDFSHIKNAPKPQTNYQGVAGKHNLYQLNDVSVPTPTNGQVLKYNSTNQRWEAGTDTAGTPAGSDTQVQFNDGGSFGGDSGFTYNKTTDSASLVGDLTVADEVYGVGWNGSLEVPTKNALYDKISTLPDGSGATNLITYWSDADTITSDSAFVVNPTDNRIGIQATTPLNPLHVTSTVTETISPPASVTVTKVLETALAVPTGSATLEYMPLVPTTPLTSETNIGAGYFTASFQTINYEIYAINTIDGVDYYVGSTTATSYTDTSGDSHTFDVSISWDSMTYADKYIVYNTSNGYYYDVGASTSMTDNGTGTAGSPSVTSGGGGILATGQTINFVPVSAGTAPSGNTYYSADGSTYSITDTVNDSTHVFLINHSITGATSDTWTIKDTTNTLGYSGSGTSYVQVGLFGGDVDITVKHYGWLSNGTNLNRTYKVYSFKTTFYSATATENNTTDANDSNYYSISVSWTSVTGATTYKIFNKATSGAYANSKIQASPATDDVLDNAWSQATTITPSTGVAPITTRFDYPSANSATSNAQLAIVDTTGSGTRYSKISFGIAADSATDGTYQTHIYSRSDNSSLHLAANSVIFLATPGGTETNTIGSTNEFNKSKSGTAYTRIWSSVTANPAINVDHSTGQVSIFGTTGSANIGLMVRAQSNTGVPLIIRNFSASPGDHPFIVQSNVGGTLARVSTGGSMQGSGLVGTPALSFTGDVDTGLYNVTSNTMGFSAGGTEQARMNTTGLSLKIASAATDYLYIGAGTTSLAPIRLTSGSLTTAGNIRVGQLQFLTDKLHFTITTGTAVKEITLNDIALTSGRVALVTTNGRLTDLSTITYAAGVITATGFTGAHNGTLGATTPAAAIVTSLQADSITNDTGLASGTYTPTLTGVTNVTSTTARQATYMRVGNTVTVAGQFDVTPTAVGLTVVGISLPVASAFTTAYQLGGAGHTPTVAGHGASIMADATNDRAQLSYVDTAASADTMTYTFTYQVI